MTRYKADPQDPAEIYPLLETADKGVHTAAVAAKYKIPASRIIIIGDSGGDGPHFAWGAQAGAILIASMAKPSLIRYCSDRHITINHFFGHIYASGETVSLENEQNCSLRELWPLTMERIGKER